MSERASFKVGSYGFTLPVALPRAVRKRIVKALQNVAEGMDKSDVERVRNTETEMWVAAAHMMSLADPPPPRPVRELFTTPALLTIFRALAEEQRR
jgi:hypothetical protein